MLSRLSPADPQRSERPGERPLVRLGTTALTGTPTARTTGVRASPSPSI